MRRAYRKRDVGTYIWAFLKLTEEEIKRGVPPKTRTFTGREIVGFVNSLVNLERVRKEKPETLEPIEPDWGAWGSPPPLSVVTEDEREEDDDETDVDED
jgi:hypothetical protein